MWWVGIYRATEEHLGLGTCANGLERAPVDYSEWRYPSRNCYVDCQTLYRDGTRRRNKLTHIHEASSQLATCLKGYMFRVVSHLVCLFVCWQIPFLPRISQTAGSILTIEVSLDLSQKPKCLDRFFF